MHIKSFIVAGLAAVASAIPASQVASNIDQVTTASRELQAPAKQLSVLDAPLILVGQGNFPPIVTGFTDIVQTLQVFLDQMDPETYSGNGADVIFDSFRTFVYVHQELLNILIGKAGLFSTVPIIGQPVSAVLRALEAAIDTFVLSLIDMMESRVMDMKASAKALGSTLDTTIDAYNGLVE
ncbi:hypothetical protein PHISP_06221 [Aspergillus sp. HF37]|nr:hypothetical protein PHISP_06221 [Aspergillus sp. HF37]